MGDSTSREMAGMFEELPESGCSFETVPLRPPMLQLFLGTELREDASLCSFVQIPGQECLLHHPKFRFALACLR